MVSFGVDVSKDWVDIARTDNSRQCKREDHVLNNEQALTAYWQQQQSAHPRLTVTVESTGMYHLALVRVCLELGITVSLVNPIITKQFTRASVRKIKTDRHDAHRIALLGLAHSGYVVTSEQLALTKFYLRASSRLASVSRTLQATSSHYQLAGIPEPALRETFGVCQDLLRQASAKLLAAGVELCDARTMTLLQSLPGFGPVTTARIVAEVGAIERFRVAQQLIAYAGLDPVIRTSGKTLNNTGKLTKRGSPHLRHALFLAAATARRYDPELRIVYERKRAQGKSYKQAVIHVARLLIHRLYAVWKRGTPYIKST